MKPVPDASATPARVIGVLGAGQLGRMLALAGIPLGLEFVFLTDRDDDCAAALGDTIVAPYTDEKALLDLASRCDAITFEFENVPAGSVRFLAERVPVRPGASLLEVAQDRIDEKRMLVDAGVATPAFAAVDSLDALHAAVDAVGLPAVIKTRRFGYDGKGQRVLRSRDDIQAAWDELGSYPLIAEALVPFVRELSVIAVRSIEGEVRVYPLAENHHAGGILRRSVVPAPNLDGDVRAEAHAIVRRIMERHDYVGVLTVELFEFGQQDAQADGTARPRLMANEIAPRVHNSGHWSIDGAVTGQFENHVRAVAGLPLGECSARCACVMENVIGEPPDVRAVLAEPNAKLHMYGKSPRDGRKLGHITRFDGVAPASL